MFLRSDQVTLSDTCHHDSAAPMGQNHMCPSHVRCFPPRPQCCVVSFPATLQPDHYVIFSVLEGKIGVGFEVVDPKWKYGTLLVHSFVGQDRRRILARCHGTDHEGLRIIRFLVIPKEFCWKPSMLGRSRQVFKRAGDGWDMMVGEYVSITGVEYDIGYSPSADMVSLPSRPYSPSSALPVADNFFDISEPRGFSLYGIFSCFTS